MTLLVLLLGLVFVAETVVPGRNRRRAWAAHGGDADRMRVHVVVEGDELRADVGRRRRRVDPVRGPPAGGAAW